jgi:hypothetical protein
MKLRSKTKHFISIENNSFGIFKTKYCIEGLYNGKWIFLGGVNESWEFDTTEERDKKIVEIAALMRNKS